MKFWVRLKFQISGTTFEELLPLFCHHWETAIVTEFSCNVSITVLTAYALKKNALEKCFGSITCGFALFCRKALIAGNV